MLQGTRLESRAKYIIIEFLLTDKITKNAEILALIGILLYFFSNLYRIT